MSMMLTGKKGINLLGEKTATKINRLKSFFCHEIVFILKASRRTFKI
jgi:hypothetical protein